MAASKKTLTVKSQRSISLAWFSSGMVSLFGFGVIFLLIFYWDTSVNGVENIGKLNRKLCAVITLGLFEISFILMAVANHIVSAIERSGSGTEFPAEEYCCPHCNEPILEGVTICHACRGVLVWVPSGDGTQPVLPVKKTEIEPRDGKPFHADPTGWGNEPKSVYSGFGGRVRFFVTAVMIILFTNFVTVKFFGEVPGVLVLVNLLAILPFTLFVHYSQLRDKAATGTESAEPADE